MKKLKTPTRSAAPHCKPMTVLGRAALADTIGGSGETARATGGGGPTQRSDDGSHGC